MKNYILGYYAPSDRLVVTLANEKNRKMLTALLNSYPASMKVKDIASKGKISVKTAYGHGYLRRLVEDGFIRQVEEPEETGGSSKYVIENVNSLLRDRCTIYSLAPGNVEYTEEFKNALNRLKNQSEIKTQFRTLLGFVKNIVESVKESDEKHVKQIAPTKDSDYVCSTCGLNHEARDFIRAVLMYLLDQFELSSDYLEFLREQNYIDKEHFNEYYKLIQENLRKRKSEELLTETQFTRPGMNDEQIVTEAWFKRMSPTTKKTIEKILIAKPEITKEQIMNLIEDKKRKIGKNDLGKDLLTYHGATFLVAEDLGIRDKS